MPKNDENQNICKENFRQQEFFQWFLWKEERILLKKKDMKESYFEFTEACDEAEAWLSLAIIKINVVEEMKHKLNKMRDQFKKWKTKRKFRMQPIIVETITVMFLQKDEESYLKELKDQEDQLKNFLTLMMKNFNGKELCPIWLAIDGDHHREHFIKYFGTAEDLVYFRLTVHGLYALIKYFNQHPSASNIILEYMLNKKGFKCEKNFYVSLMELPQKFGNKKNSWF